MEEIKWDREAFAQQQQHRAAGPGLATSLGGLILLMITIGVVVGGGYWFLKTRGMAPALPQIELPSIGGIGQPSMNERLAALDLRLAEIEKRLSIPPPKPAAKPSAISSNASRGAQSSSPSRPAATSSATPATESIPSSSASAPASFEGTDIADREGWEAAADRLGMAAGELSEQRRDIARTQDDLIQLRQQMERAAVPFRLWKNRGRYRVGPISLTLQSTDRKNQRYNLLLHFDDRTVQMKDRALGERVEFYIAGEDAPLELVVSEILADRISGNLAVPTSGVNSLSQ